MVFKCSSCMKMKILQDTWYRNKEISTVQDHLNVSCLTRTVSVFLAMVKILQVYISEEVLCLNIHLINPLLLFNMITK